MVLDLLTYKIYGQKRCATFCVLSPVSIGRFCVFYYPTICQASALCMEHSCCFSLEELRSSFFSCFTASSDLLQNPSKTCEVALSVCRADTVLSESVCFWQHRVRFSECCLYSDMPFLSYFLHILLKCTEWAERLRSAFHLGLLSTMHGLFSLGTLPRNSFTLTCKCQPKSA